MNLYYNDEIEFRSRPILETDICEIVGIKEEEFEQMFNSSIEELNEEIYMFHFSYEPTYQKWYVVDMEKKTIRGRNPDGNYYTNGFEETNGHLNSDSEKWEVEAFLSDPELDRGNMAPEIEWE